MSKLLYDYQLKELGGFNIRELIDWLILYDYKLKELGGSNIRELIDWLKGEKYIIDDYSDSMTEEFEKKHAWELRRNRMIEKTINKIEEMQK